MENVSLESFNKIAQLMSRDLWYVKGSVLTSYYHLNVSLEFYNNRQAHNMVLILSRLNFPSSFSLHLYQ